MQLGLEEITQTSRPDPDPYRWKKGKKHSDCLEWPWGKTKRRKGDKEKGRRCYACQGQRALPPQMISPVTPKSW